MAGPIGYIFHRSSGKLVHPLQGWSQPPNDWDLVVHSDKHDPARLQFRFVPVESFGHFGYIEHVSSRKTVHPSFTTAWGTQLVFHSDRHAGALFAFDEENERILYKGYDIPVTYNASTIRRNFPEEMIFPEGIVYHHRRKCFSESQERWV